ncbi:hypothetical protein PE066_00335 [Ramlibacter tataouinensis]|uniref:hypothetical protein n=1 Tax=Ramlibacter tataouinensis TaxID=94132 RepID=UPI0022F3ACE3|nr:hypothetical protein [Ramlibacter tataouinensis]WBY02021.1 hypothetical protein PE066_00335 [Ramlibacter tataouinensis]
MAHPSVYRGRAAGGQPVALRAHDVPRDPSLPPPAPTPPPAGYEPPVQDPPAPDQTPPVGEPPKHT